MQAGDVAASLAAERVASTTLAPPPDSIPAPSPTCCEAGKDASIAASEAASEDNVSGNPEQQGEPPASSSTAVTGEEVPQPALHAANPLGAASAAGTAAVKPSEVPATVNVQTEGAAGAGAVEGFGEAQAQTKPASTATHSAAAGAAEPAAAETASGAEGEPASAAAPTVAAAPDAAADVAMAAAAPDSTPATNQGASQAAAAAPTADAAAAAAAGTSAQAAAPAAAGASYGDAAASLADPACQPGSQEFVAAEAENKALLQQYNTLERALHARGAFKPDMQANKQLKERLGDKLRSGLYGHVPGVAVGQQFIGRGELAVLGLHGQMMKGIDCRQGRAAFAICMSGGYKDDDDGGTCFSYTGAGGQKAKRQVSDQSYDTPDNAALVQNYESGTPVRVFRGKKQEAGKGYPIYTYEGLYTITGHSMEPSADGPMVIRFRMQGVPGHSVVSGKVEYQALRRSAGLTKIRLAGAEGRQERPNKRRKLTKGSGKGLKWHFVTPTAQQVAAQLQERAKAGTCGRLVTADLSQGAEKVPVAVWNSVDEDDEIHVCSGLDALDAPAAAAAAEGAKSGFEYITGYRFTAADNAEEVAQRAAELFARDCPTKCGTQYHGGDCRYNIDGCLMTTEPYGVMECEAKCDAAKGCTSKTRRAQHAAACKRNRVVSEGLKYPLEVFKTPDRGWALRSSVDLPKGVVICAYIGEVITDGTAEQLRGADMYLYDLHDFHTREQELAKLAKLGQPDPDANPNYPPIPAELRETSLVVDAGRRGNVARFINHSCDPNCVQTVVFADGARSQLLYYNVIAAAQDIPAFTEITYHYGDMYVVEGEEATLAETAAETAAASSPAAGAAPASAECSAAQASGMAKASSASSAAGAATAAAAGAPDTAAVAAVAGEQQEQRQAGAGEGGKAGGGVAAEKRTRCKCGAAKCRGWLKI